MKDMGSDRFEVFSAGVKPKGQVSPITLKVLQDKFRIDASGARSKSWEEFKDERLDFIVSVSEQAEQKFSAKGLTKVTDFEAYVKKKLVTAGDSKDVRKKIVSTSMVSIEADHSNA